MLFENNYKVQEVGPGDRPSKKRKLSDSTRLAGSLQTIPDAVHREILAFLSKTDLCRVAPVSSRWTFNSIHCTTWRQFDVPTKSRNAERFVASEFPRRCAYVREVRLAAAAFTDRSSIELIAKLAADLEYFDCSGYKFIQTEDILKILQKSAGLKVFKANLCVELTGEVLAALQLYCPRIEVISLNYCRLVSIPEDLTLPALRVLNLNSCGKVTSQALEALVRASKTLEELTIGGAINVSDRLLGAIASSCSRLRHLSISSLNPFGGNKLASEDAICTLIGSCPQLRSLEARGCYNVGGEVLAAVQRTECKIQKLDLRGCRNIEKDETLVAPLKLLSMKVPELLVSQGNLKPEQTEEK